MRLPIVAVIGAFLAIAATWSGVAVAQDWPTQTVKIITPFAAGSGGDITARPFADGLSKRWGKPVIVENRPGADGIVAVNAVLAANDGHTVLYTNGGPLTSNLLSHAGKLPYDPARDLIAISGGAEVFVAIGVPAALSVTSIAEFLKLAKSQPGQLNWGATPGSLDYLLPGFFKQTGIEMVRVPYRDATSAMQDLSQSRIHFYAAGLATHLPMAQSGAVKLIAVTNKVHSPMMPELATAEQSGFPGLTYEAFLGFFGPRIMSAALVDRISADIRVVGADAELARKFAAIGMKLRVTTPAELDSLVASERAALKKMTAGASSIPAR
jgi:tripartite-type tricarboxylate transporter receptor subunit TctC